MNSILLFGDMVWTYFIIYIENTCTKGSNTSSCNLLKSLNKQVFIPLGTGSWDDTDEDEKTLKELRETFKTEKKKEQEAEELRLKLESQAEGREQCHHRGCHQYLFPSYFNRI